MENITRSDEMAYMPFPIPGATSEKLFVKLLNPDIKYEPVVAKLKIESGTFIPAHIHHKTEEQHYVLEGDFINDGVTYGPGTFSVTTLARYTGRTAPQEGTVYFSFSRPR